MLKTIQKMTHCHIAVPNPLKHELVITLTFNTEQNSIDLFLPKWRPGRYEAADFAVNLSNIIFLNDQSTPLTSTQFSSNGWHIELGQTKTWTAQYTYYANKMDAGNSVVDEKQIYINFINCILYAEELMDLPFELEIDIPKDYQIATALKKNKAANYETPNYHELADSPLLASESLKILNYQVAGSNFKIAFMGDHPLDDEQIISDFEKFTQAQCDTMDGFVCDEYWFLVQSLDYQHYHGVEHQNSTVLVLGPNDQNSKNEYYDKLMGVASHELFHCWNVTRIRPSEMSPYNYKDEINFETGFVAEGFTTYYGDYFLKTSHVFNSKEYYKEINTLLKRHFENFGRIRISLLDSSKRLWMDGYKNIFPSNKVSIYVKGALSSLILDLHIRKVTNHEKSLIDIVKRMYQLHKFSQGGYSWADVKGLLEEIGGPSTLTLAEELVESECDLEPYLIEAFDQVGCQLEKIAHSDDFMSKTGAKIQEELVVDLIPGSWSEEFLSIGDKIQKADSDSSKIKVLRNDQSINFELNVDHQFIFEYSIVENPKASTDQIGFRKKWLK